MKWNLAVDEAMFLGGLEKGPFLREFEPDFSLTTRRAMSPRPRCMCLQATCAPALPNPPLVADETTERRKPKA